MSMDDHKAAAYGGKGWQPRVTTHIDEIGSVWADCGINSEWAPLKSVLLHTPGDELNASMDPEAAQMLAPLDVEKAKAEHILLSQCYQEQGITVIQVEPRSPAHPNQMFCADLVFMTPEGAVLARPASLVRAGEEVEVARILVNLGIPILKTLTGNATFEGADAMWIDARTVVIGLGQRTNSEGAAQVTSVLNAQGVDVLTVDMPINTMHLMGMFRIFDGDLAVGWTRRTPYRLVETIKNKGFQLIFIEEEPGQPINRGINAVTCGPRKILMPDGYPETQKLFENHDVKCITSPTTELQKAAGAIGCLTGVLHREKI